MPQSPPVPVVPMLVFYAGLTALVVATVRLLQGDSSGVEHGLLAAGILTMAVAIWLGARRRRA